MTSQPNRHKPSQATQSAMCIAWEIRRKAAAHWGVAVSQIDMGECLRWAWQIKRERAIKRNGNVWQGRRVYVPEAAYNAMGIRFDHYARRRGVANVHGPNGYYSGNRKHQDALKQSYYDLERGEWVLPELAQELGIEAQLIKWMTR